MGRVAGKIWRQGPIRGYCILIFVTAGSHNQGFGRLIKKADEIAKETEEDFVIQKGHTDYKPANAEFFDFASRDEMQELVKKARIVISHGGAGSIIFALNAGKPLIVVPRLKKYGEHVNDHQIELVRAMEKEGKVKAVYDIEHLGPALEAIDDAIPIKREKPVMIEVIKNYLKELEQK